jgi:adenosine deaminase
MTASAQTTPRIQITERIIANQIGAASPTVSPIGRHVAYVVTRVDHKANKYRSQVWLARTAARSHEIAELAVKFRDKGVVGFDIAGAEAGYPPTRHLDAFQFIQRSNFHTTIHAGEAFGLPSIWEALQFCGAERLGHGVRIVDDITGEPGHEVLGRLAEFVRDRRIPLELCPTSNVNTGVCASIAEHPIGMLRRLRFRVTLNTDNRLMSNTSMTREFTQCADAFGWTLDDFQWITVNSVKSAFAHFEERLKIINEIVKPRYAALR